MTKDEALKLALEALENIDRWLPTIGQKGLRDYEADAITAIKEALAQPEQDWIERERAVGYREGHRAALAQRTWVGLTLDERIELAQDVDWAIGAYCEYAEKIEAKLKELNG